MATRSILTTATLALATLTMIPDGFGQEALFDARRDGATASDGIRTDHLTPRQLQTWRSIEQIVQAVDRAGRPLHPRLFGLRQWARTCGHQIYIELVDEKVPRTSHAGLLTVRGSAENGASRVAVIQLWRSLIENAPVYKETRLGHGFISFAGLSKLERYALVLGHELTHAALHLQDPEYSRLCMDLEAEAEAFLSFRQQNLNSSSYDQTMQRRLERIRSLTDQIEKPARLAEVEIRQELIEGQRAKTATR